MKILFLTTIDPYEIDSGGSVVTRQDIKLLSNKFSVDVKYCGNLKNRLKGKNFVYFLLNVFSFKSMKVSSYCGIKNFNNYMDYDLVWCNFDYTAFDYKNILKANKKYVIRKHNYEYELVSKYFLFGFERFLLKRFELKVMKNASAVFHISKLEYLKDENKNKVLLFPTIIENDYSLIPLTFCNKSRDIDVLLVSDFTWKPNCEGAVWFLENVKPLLNKEYKVHIIGKNSETFNHFNGVITYGYVQDLNSYYKRAKVFVVPILRGAGVKIKLLNSMKNLLPIVTTSKGVYGLPLKDEYHILIADKPEDFALRIEILINDVELSSRLILKSYNWLQENCSTDSNLTKLNSLIKL